MAASEPLWKSYWFWGAAALLVGGSLWAARKRAQASDQSPKPRIQAPRPPQPRGATVLRYPATGLSPRLLVPGNPARSIDCTALGDDVEVCVGWATESAYAATVKANEGIPTAQQNWQLIVEIPADSPIRQQIADQTTRTVVTLNTPRRDTGQPIEPGSTPIGQRPHRNTTPVQVIIRDTAATTTQGHLRFIPAVPPGLAWR